MEFPFTIPQKVKNIKKYQKGLSILLKLRKKGYQAYFVGGVVRDLILKSPLKDIDIATSATPEEVQSLFRKCKKVGAKFGVAMVYMGKDSFEVATFRQDQDYDGRRPKRVVFVDAKEDVLRRDFTINGLLLDPVKEKIWDYVGGLKDIQEKCLRAIGNPIHRFQEDHLRMLRAIRFSCYLNFKIHRDTYQAILETANKIVEISKERIKEELWKILTSPYPQKGIQLLFDTRLMEYILPEAYVFWKDHLESLKDCFAKLRGMEIALFLAVLFKGQDPHHTPQILRNRLKIDNTTSNQVKEILISYEEVAKNPQISLSEEKKLLRKEIFYLFYPFLAIFSRKKAKYFLKKRILYTYDELFPPKIITGYDLKLLSLPQGHLYSKILEEIENLQLEGKVKTRKEALTWIQKKYSPFS